MFASGARTVKDKLRRVRVTDYLEATAKAKGKKFLGSVIENILSGQAKAAGGGKEGNAALAQMMRQAASGQQVEAIGDAQTQARVRGALEGVLISEASRDPSALVDAALTADILEKGGSPSDVTETLKNLPLSGADAGTQEAVRLRDEVLSGDKTLDKLRQEAKRRETELTPGSQRTREARAALESLEKRVRLLRTVLVAAAKERKFKTKAAVERFLKQRAKAFIAGTRE